MEELKRIIEDYIKIEQTSYAILIKGSWGSGKTHFFNKQLSCVIKKSGLQPLYISLYGIGTLEDLSKTLVLAIFPFLQSKTAKRLSAGADIVSGALSTLSIAGFSLDLNKIVDKFDISKWVSVSKNKVLCFDDIERAKLEVGQILGFINNFVEHDNIKTILIANEDEIINNQLKENYPEKVQAAIQALVKKDPDKNIQSDELSKTIDDLFRSKISYPTIKEKLVGRTVEYIPDIESIFDSITNIYKSDKELKSFLDSNKQIIIKIFQKSNTKNIRTLKGALDTFKVVYIALRKTGDSTLHKHELGVLAFILAVSLEIKTDEARIPEFRNINSKYDFKLGRIFRKDEEPVPYLTSFYDKYFSEGIDADVSKAVIQYIVDGFFDEEAFLEEYRQEEKKIDEKNSKIRSILNFSEINDASFKQAIEDVMRYVAKGEIHLYKYPQLFEYFEYFSQSGLIKENIGKLRKVFLRGIDTASKRIIYKDIRNNEYVEAPVQGTRSLEYLEVKKSVNDHAMRLREAHWIKDSSELIDLLPDHFEEFRSTYYDQAHEFETVPIFKYYSGRKLPGRILHLRTEDIFQFARMLDKRYNDLNFTPNLREDYTNIKILLDEIEKLMAKRKRKTLRIHWLEQLASVLRKASERFQPTDGVIS